MSFFPVNVRLSRWHVYGSCCSWFSGRVINGGTTFQRFHAVERCHLTAAAHTPRLAWSRVVPRVSCEEGGCRGGTETGGKECSRQFYGRSNMIIQRGRRACVSCWHFTGMLCCRYGISWQAVMEKPFAATVKKAEDKDEDTQRLTTASSAQSEEMK